VAVHKNIIVWCVGHRVVFNMYMYLIACDTCFSINVFISLQESQIFYI